MTWNLRDFLWADRVGCLEYLFQDLFTAYVSFDPTAGYYNGTLTNNNLTATGQAWSSAPYQPVDNVLQVIEFSIDVLVGDMKIGFNATTSDNIPVVSGFTPTYSSSGTSTTNFGHPFVQGDRIAIGFYGSGAGTWLFFINGTLITSSYAGTYAPSLPHIVVDPAGGVITMIPDTASMMYFSAYNTAPYPAPGYPAVRFAVPATGITADLSPTSVANGGTAYGTLSANGYLGPTTTVSVTIASSDSGDDCGGTNTLTASSPTTYFAIRSGGAGGPHTLTFTADSGLTSPSPITLTVAAPPANIALTSGVPVTIYDTDPQNNYYITTVGASNIHWAATVTASAYADLLYKKGAIPGPYSNDGVLYPPGSQNITPVPNDTYWFKYDYIVPGATVTMTVTVT